MFDVSRIFGDTLTFEFTQVVIRKQSVLLNVQPLMRTVIKGTSMPKRYKREIFTSRQSIPISSVTWATLRPHQRRHTALAPSSQERRDRNRRLWAHFEKRSLKLCLAPHSGILVECDPSLRTAQCPTEAQPFHGVTWEDVYGVTSLEETIALRETCASH